VLASFHQLATVEWTNIQSTPLEKEAVVARFQAKWAKAEIILDPTKRAEFTDVHLPELQFRR
jgi:hypothetical protein